MSYPSSIQAITFSKTGDYDVIEKTTQPFPNVKPGDIVVKVQYGGVNFIDTYFRKGLYPVPSFPAISGGEASGIIVGLPSDQAVLDNPDFKRRGFEKGGHVAVNSLGAFAEYISVPWTDSFPVPAGLSTRLAVAGTLQGITAISFMDEGYDVQKGDIILVHTVAGGLGLILLQYAKSKGATVIGTTSTKEKAALAKEHGADHVILYTEEDTVKRVLEITNNEGVHAIFDGVGAATFDSDFKMIRRKGTILTLGNASGAVPPFAPLKLTEKNVKLLRPTMKNYIATPEEGYHYSSKVFGLIANGTIKVNIHKDYPFTAEGVVESQKDLTGGKTTGKLIIDIASEETKFETDVVVEIHALRQILAPITLCLRADDFVPKQTLTCLNFLQVGKPAMLPLFALHGITLEYKVALVLRLQYIQAKALQVCKYLFELSHTPAIWKRLLRLMNIIPPPLPPTKRNNMEYLTGVQAQKMVIRSISFNNNWRSAAPKVFSTQSSDLQQSVQSMVALPGGEHVIAVVADKDHTSYALELLIVDPRGSIIPLAKMPTESKPYNVRAKYLTFNGVTSIAVAYVRREFYGNASPECSPSQYDEYTENLPHPLRYECSVVAISLQNVEDLVELITRHGPHEYLRHAAARPAPFTRLSTIRSRSPLTALDLAEVVGVPYVAVVKHHETIVFKNLNNGSMSSLTVSRWPHLAATEHRIQNFRILPHHRELLLVLAVPDALPVFGDSLIPPTRRTPGSVEGHLVACVFSMPRDAEDVRDREPYEYRILEQNAVFGPTQISDPAVPVHMDQSIRPLHLQADVPHVSIYYESLSQGCAVELRVPPYRPYSAPHAPVPFFAASTMSWETEYAGRGERGRPEIPLDSHVSPGHTRPLLWTTLRDRAEAPTLVNFISQIREHGTGEVKECTTFGKARSLPSIRVKQTSTRSAYGVPVEIPALFRHRLRRGIRSVAWDDWSGRIFVATPEDCGIHLIDLAKNPMQYANGAMSRIVL
ncbi:hypothetical protein HWV62_10248 [Athelia sp. TMB]|nr:hypothetical protein HWV62_10248 [Athelia sp. TMB]